MRDTPTHHPTSLSLSLCRSTVYPTGPSVSVHNRTFLFFIFLFVHSCFHDRSGPAAIIMADQSRKDINRAMSMAEAAPMLSTTPRGPLGSAFQEETSFDSRGGAKGASGSAAAGAASVSSSSSRKPGRYVSADQAVFPCLLWYVCCRYVQVVHHRSRDTKPAACGRTYRRQCSKR